jgi:large subunit ribosomal protein L21
MAKYAVIRLKGKQYKVSEGEVFLADLMGEDKPEVSVLLLADGEKVSVGKPLLTGVKVKFKVVTALEKGEKVDILKYKSKSRYRRRMGFRPKYTRLLIEKIG